MVSTKKLQSFEYGIFMLLMVYASLEVTEAAFMDDKRASGFVGMRGKKESHLNFDDYLDTNTDDYYEAKRSGSGFVGMRGKKDQEDQEDLYYAPMEAASKRAGFVGMRGKKSKNYWPSFWYAPALNHRETRGSSSSGFVGMRGRR